MLLPNDWKGFSTSIGREKRESSLRNRCYVLLHLFFLYAVLFIVFRLPKCENLERTDDDDDDSDGDDAGQFGTTSHHREFRCRGCGQPTGSGSALDDATRPASQPSQAKSHNTSGSSAFLPQQPFNVFTFGCAACFPLPTLGVAKLLLAHESEAQSYPSEVAWGAAVWEEGPPSV